MTYQGERGPAAPRLPQPGWLPDPSRTDLERFWDGRSWTSRTRNAVTHVEPQPTLEPARAGTRPRRRAAGRWTLAALILGAVLFAVASYQGQVPAWVPYGSVLQRAQPAPARVEYPVFGSDELVRYLAAGMVAQEGTIDVSYWMRVEHLSVDAITDAVYEAAAQNPYLFISAWSLDVSGRLQPQYVYEKDVAESKRYLTAQAVTRAMADATVASATTPAQQVAAIHDYIANTATYDYTSADAIDAGSGFDNSPLVAQSQEAYGILVAHTAVCNGYAQAFQLLARAAGLESVIVTGTATGLTTGAHAWNEVRVDGRWRVVDVTWDDDDVGGVRDDFLMVPPGDPVLASRTPDLDWVVDANAGDYAS